MAKKVTINKADDNSDVVHELTNIETEMVSLVNAGANRQVEFAVVKTDGEAVDDLLEGLDQWLNDFDDEIDQASSFDDLEIELESDDDDQHKTKQLQKDNEQTAKIAELEAKIESLKTELKKSRHDVGVQKARAQNAEKSAKTLRTKLTKLQKASVGSSTALVTGDLRTPAQKTKEAGPEKQKKWRSGQDLAD